MQLYNIFQQHPFICTDSRTCEKGALFFALKGENFDANAFAKNALENGCSYAIIDDAAYATDSRYILVEDVLITLQELARFHRKMLGTKLLAITGTNGKTTTKELIAAALNEKYNVLYTQGNLNNHIGVPLTLLKMKPEHDIAIIEMGANHPGEIKILAEIACPDFGIITNVGKAHLEGFGSFEGVKKTKAELYKYLLKNGKDIFINHDNEHLKEMILSAGMAHQIQLHEYSLNNLDCPVFGQIVSCSPFLNMKCKVENSADFDVNTKLIGTYNAENILAAVAIANYFDVESKKIKTGLEKYTPQNNRSQLTVTKRNKLVIDAYNANPTSMKAAIINFGQMEVQHKVLIIGDMFELGQKSNEEHQNIIQLIEQYQFDKVILVGTRFMETDHHFISYPSAQKLLENSVFLDEINNSYVLIKGSRGVKLEQIVHAL